MRSDAPALLPIFRSRHQAQLLATLFLHPDREYTITELAQLVGAPVSTLHREVERLVRAGILRDRTVGRTRLLSANTGTRISRPLGELLAVTFGPLEVVADEFRDLHDVDLVAIYGSWAARYHGDLGPPPQDLDVLVVGTTPRTAVYDAAERTQQRLGIPVNAIISSRQRWTNIADALIQQIRTSPLMVVVDTGTLPPEERS